MDKVPVTTSKRGCWAIDLRIARLLYFSTRDERTSFCQFSEHYELVGASHPWVQECVNKASKMGIQYTREEFLSPDSPAIPPCLKTS